MEKPVFASIDEYIAQFSPEVQELLRTLREVIKEAAPGAQEKISYQMPAFDLHGILVYFAAHKNHIGFYPTASGIDAFKEKVSQFKTSKGAVQFPLNKPLPWDLVREIVRFRAAENIKKAKTKINKRK
ncbi:MAG: DUF1801 domain-containing protein [Syntrophomonadaceae bacterium]